MPSAPRLYEHGQVYFVTSRTEEGLPFVPLKTINALIESCLAKALNLYPATIIAYCFLSNHLHLLFRVHDPQQAPALVQYIKQEMAHAINRIVGRRQKTIWQREYDNPRILTSARAIAEIAYCLANPCEADLVEHTKDYPGVSSYHSLFNDGPTAKKVPIFKRSSFTKFTNSNKPYREDDGYLADLLAENKNKLQLVVNPWIIKDVFPELGELSIEQLRSIPISTPVNDWVVE